MRIALPLIGLLCLLATAPAAEATTRVAVYCTADGIPMCGASVRDTDTNCTPWNPVGVCSNTQGEILVGVVVYSAPDPCTNPDCYGGVVGAGPGEGCTAADTVLKAERPSEDVDLGGSLELNAICPNW